MLNLALAFERYTDIIIGTEIEKQVLSSLSVPVQSWNRTTSLKIGSGPRRRLVESMVCVIIIKGRGVLGLIDCWRSSLSLMTSFACRVAVLRYWPLPRRTK